jgi:monoamine oxidase
LSLWIFPKAFFMHAKITILGAGLTGLTLAHLLKREGIDFQIIEAKQRVGGRMFTKMSGNHIPIDLGAAWLWDYNPRLKQLLTDLNIPVFPQEMGPKVWYQSHPNADFEMMQLPPQQQLSYRIKGGSTNLALALAATLDPAQTHLETVVKTVLLKEGGYNVETDQGSFTTDTIISCIPPAVVAHSIAFEPQLPADYMNAARQTHTWMEDSIKIGLGFQSAFWDEKGVPATAFSNAGPITELYDYSNVEKDRFALMGFLHPQMNFVSATDRKTAVLSQLEKIFGIAVLNHVSYEEYLWQQDPFTNSKPEQQNAPHQNNGAPILRRVFNNGSLIMAGSETSSEFAGYMEGAVNSAISTFNLLMQGS